MKHWIKYLAISALCIFCLSAGYNVGLSSCDNIKNDTIYIDSFDTLRIVEHDTVVENVIRYKLLEVHDTIVKDNVVYMQLPMTQRWYHTDSLCDVWVSGYEPQLDSMHIIQQHTTEIIREQITKKEMPRFNAEIGVGALYLQDRLVGSAGVEVRYNAANITYKVGAGYTTEKKPIFGVGIAYRIDL